MHTGIKHVIEFSLKLHRWVLPYPRISFNPGTGTLNQTSTNSRFQIVRTTCLHAFTAIYIGLSTFVVYHTPIFRSQRYSLPIQFSVSEFSTYILLATIPLASFVPIIFGLLTSESRLVYTINNLVKVQETSRSKPINCFCSQNHKILEMEVK